MNIIYRVLWLNEVGRRGSDVHPTTQHRHPLKLTTKRFPGLNFSAAPNSNILLRQYYYLSTVVTNVILACFCWSCTTARIQLNVELIYPCSIPLWHNSTWEKTKIPYVWPKSRFILQIPHCCIYSAHYCKTGTTKIDIANTHHLGKCVLWLKLQSNWIIAVCWETAASPGATV